MTVSTNVESTYLICSECGARVARADATELNLEIDQAAVEEFVRSLEAETGEAILRTPPDTSPLRYHWRDEVRGSWRRNVIGCHIETEPCGPLREPGPADLYEEQLEAAFGPLSAKP